MSNLFFEDLEKKSDGTYEREIRAKAIDEFAEKCNKEITEFILKHKEQITFVSGVSVAWNIIDKIAEEMRGAYNGSTD